MYQVQLTDQAYDQAKRRAAEAGFDSVDEYVVDLLFDDVVETPDLDHLFTPERIAQIEKISNEVKAGGPTYTLEELDEYLAANSAAWMRENRK